MWSKSSSVGLKPGQNQAAKVESMETFSELFSTPKLSDPDVRIFIPSANPSHPLLIGAEPDMLWRPEDVMDRPETGTEAPPGSRRRNGPRPAGVIPLPVR